MCNNTLNSHGSTHLLIEEVVLGTGWAISLFSDHFAENTLC